jgi:hypothetical protein
MEHRKEPRLKANQSVMVTPIGMIAMPPLSGRVLDMSGSGLRLVLPNPVPCGSSIKVETEHMVMVGEVCRCEMDNRVYVVGLMVLHIAAVADKPSRAIMGV